MKTNLTPAKIVEMYLPEYKKRYDEWYCEVVDELGINYVGQYGSIANKFKFAMLNFSEALAERDRMLCQKQRLLCEQHASTMLSDNGSIVINGDTIFNAPMPELKEE